MASRVVGRIMVDGIDDEWPGKDQRIHSEFGAERVLDSRTPSLNIDVPHVRWGGECRVEVDITGELVDHGHVKIEAIARLYEGMTEASMDLEEEKDIEFVVRLEGSPVHRRIHLKNREIGGGDRATVTLSFTNTLVKE